MAFTEKLLWAPGPVQVGGYRLKRYHIGSDPAGLDPAVEKAAYSVLPDLLPAPDTSLKAGFVVVHQGEGSDAYVSAYCWTRGSALSFAGAAAGQPALGCPDLSPTHFVRLTRPLVGHVWELAPLRHERDTWVRHLLAPERPDLEGYLADHYREGSTGPDPLG
ncbi:hypothetical protein [Kitasatospora viridis]|uniref:Uncharacterized protein n=1 Tax=Kitasatospora viridis TaxID=281105 RepID=A0A561UIB9_9ACTN|nr:hypothetical protein [Kitasatospora viridis]TWF99131.1 hypothetical protein FHX73_112970 [Kitasatospora viridis]